MTQIFFTVTQVSLVGSATDGSNLKGGTWLDKSDDHNNTRTNIGTGQCSENWKKTIYHIVGENALEKQTFRKNRLFKDQFKWKAFAKETPILPVFTCSKSTMERPE